MKNIIVLLLCILLSSCNHDEGLLNGLFSQVEAISLDSIQTEFRVSGLIGDICSNDSLVIVYNSGVENSYTMYNAATGRTLCHFGRIGHGNKEIPKGCVGEIIHKNYVVCKDAEKKLARFNLAYVLDTSIADTVYSYNLDDAMLSRVLPVDSNIFLGLGTFQDRFHYVTFDVQGHVFDSAVKLYNVGDPQMNRAHRFLSSQGVLARHPHRNRFVGITWRSGLIDFFSVDDRKIINIRSYSDILPSWNVVDGNQVSSLDWTEQTINGFLDITGNDDYVFSLYSEETMNMRPYKSKYVLVFDWDGHPVTLIELPYFAEYISANSTTLYIVYDNQHDEQCIGAFSLDKLESK